MFLWCTLKMLKKSLLQIYYYKLLQNIINPSDIELNDKISVLKLTLKHGILIRPNKTKMISIVKDIYDQIARLYLLKKYNISKHRSQAAPELFAYSYLNLDLKKSKLNRSKHKT